MQGAFLIIMIAIMSVSNNNNYNNSNNMKKKEWALAQIHIAQITHSSSIQNLSRFGLLLLLLLLLDGIWTP